MTSTSAPGVRPKVRASPFVALSRSTSHHDSSPRSPTSRGRPAYRRLDRRGLTAMKGTGRPLRWKDGPRLAASGADGADLVVEGVPPLVRLRRRVSVR